MPTGFTMNVAEGTVTSFKEYAKECSKYFIPECFMPLEQESAIKDNYFSIELKENTKKYKKMLKYTNDEIKKAYQKHYIDLANEFIKHNTQVLKEYNNLAAMLKKVEKYKPTKNCDKFANFLKDQLVESLDDCRIITKIELKMPIEIWWANEFNKVKNNIDYYQKSVVIEKERYDKWNKFKKDLLESINDCDV
jgi:hypothetical protein